jgi:ATP-dependent Clp protease ATP-binding subunit ClpB
VMTSNLAGDPLTLFKPEFVNRIDEIVRFRSLTEDDMLPIVDIQLRSFESRLRERRLGFVVTDEARRWLAAKGYDQAFGARPLKRLIQKAIGDQLASALLSGRYADGETVTVDADDSGLMLR